MPILCKPVVDNSRHPKFSIKCVSMKKRVPRLNRRKPAGQGMSDRRSCACRCNVSCDWDSLLAVLTFDKFAICANRQWTVWILSRFIAPVGRHEVNLLCASHRLYKSMCGVPVRQRRAKSVCQFYLACFYFHRRLTWTLRRTGKTIYCD